MKANQPVHEIVIKDVATGQEVRVTSSRDIDWLVEEIERFETGLAAEMATQGPADAGQQDNQVVQQGR